MQTEVKQDEAIVQLEEMCKTEEILSKENTALRDRISYLVKQIAQAHDSIVTKSSKPSRH